MTAASGPGKTTWEIEAHRKDSDEDFWESLHTANDPRGAQGALKYYRTHGWRREEFVFRAHRVQVRYYVEDW